MIEWATYLLYLIPLLGVILLIKGIKELKTYNYKVKNWEHITGEVIKLQDTVSANSASTLYKPIYQYEYLGEVHIGVGKIASHPPAYKVQEKIKILVNPKNVNESIIYYKSYIAVIWISILLGITIILGGSIIIYYL